MHMTAQSSYRAGGTRGKRARSPFQDLVPTDACRTLWRHSHPATLAMSKEAVANDTVTINHSTDPEPPSGSTPRMTSIQSRVTMVSTPRLSETAARPAFTQTGNLRTPFDKSFITFPAAEFSCEAPRHPVIIAPSRWRNQAPYLNSLLQYFPIAWPFLSSSRSGKVSSVLPARKSGLARCSFDAAAAPFWLLRTNVRLYFGSFIFAKPIGFRN